MTDTHVEYNPDDEPMPEGSEEAPPFTHTMSIVRWVILIAMTLFALTMVLTYFGATPWAQNAGSAVQYHCPMHPTYVSSQPGECPICGMNLVPVGSEAKTDTVAIADSHMAKPGQYTCPMDPQIVSDTAGKCPICGMNLELVTAAPGDDMKHAGHTADLGSAPVPGLVPVTIEPQRLQLIGVRTGTVTRRNVSNTTPLVGYVTPDESKVSNLTVRVSGWVQKLNVNETGQRVTKEQPLLTLYSQDLYQAEQDFLAALSMTRQDGTDAALAITHNQILDAARERLRLLGLTTDDITQLENSGTARPEISLRSPYDGVVLEKNVNDGQQVTPDQRLFTIADLRTIWVLADVYEADIASVRIGQPTTMTIAAYPNEQFTGKVSFIYPTISEQTRTLKVRIEFANADFRLRPGMYAQIELAGGADEVLAVSRDAVMDGGEIAYAFVIHNGTHFEPRLIKIGRSTGDYVEVQGGLSEGETVVTSANFLIDSESRLKAAISGMGGAQADPHAGHGK